MALRRSLHRIRFLVFLVSTLVQIPLLLLLARLAAPHTWAPWALAALLTVPYLMSTLRRPFGDEPKPRWLLYLVLWPFFCWWATSSIYLVLSPFLLIGARLFGVTSELPFIAGAGVALLFGLWSVRRTPRLVEIDVAIEGLPAVFDGYRIGQISDVHCGSYTPKGRIDRWVAALNAAAPDLIAVTGDLISSGDRYIEEVAASLGGLAAPDGVFACMGNHDYFCDAERLVGALEQRGLQLLRNRGQRLARDGASLYLAGIEDTWTRRNDLRRALADRRPDEHTLLLAHDPNVFVEASKARVSLQLSGHTHGGQIALPVKRYNLARLISPFTHGLHSRGGSQLYVSRGAGTSGPPVRLFAPAELTILTLRTAIPA